MKTSIFKYYNGSKSILIKNLKNFCIIEVDKNFLNLDKQETIITNENLKKLNSLDFFETINQNEEILDYKTILQEYAQKKFKIIPVYKLISEVGPDHMKEFEMEVQVLNYSGKAKAGNKKKAEQLSAKDLCTKLGVKYNETL